MGSDAPMTEVAAGRLETLAALLRHAPLNLVSRSDRAQVYDRHIRECVAIGTALAPSPGSRWIDLGTGGGLPGLVLAIQHPWVHWTLIDATAKKIRAVQGFAEQLGIENVVAVAGRAETLSRGRLRGCFDGLVVRAVAPLRVLAELGRGFLVPGGRLVAVKGPAWSDELAQAQRALEVSRLSFLHSIELQDVARPTWLVTMRAAGPAPAEVPRRDGLPRSQPL